ncbi:YceI family protein [Amycolatopsis sp. cmx-4-61]|uniref:YceI family protein n=1 Tax=Amycolatopsis sp. cmx-4-61 TaxID=2790937 RepID=UPI003979BC85
MPDTELLPATVLRTLRRDRCVVEPSIRLLRVPVLRGRLAATGGHLDLDGRHLTLTLDADPVRLGPKPLRRALTGARGLRAADHPAITFTSANLHVGPGDAVDVTGKVEVAGAPRHLHLTGDLRRAGDESIVLWVKGTLPAPRRRPRRLGIVARLLAGRRIHVEIAAEFVR